MRTVSVRLSGLTETHVANIDCDHLHIDYRLPIGTPRVSAPLRREMDTISYDVVGGKLRRGESSSNVYIIIVPAKSQILAEEEILHEAVSLNRAWKISPQDAPRLAAFLPRLDFLNTNAVHPKDEGGRKISPQSFTVEVGTMQRIPRRTHLMTSKRILRRPALGYCFTVEFFNRNPIRGEHRSLVWRSVG
jgi:hypothetical protein